MIFNVTVFSKRKRNWKSIGIGWLQEITKQTSVLQAPIRKSSRVRISATKKKVIDVIIIKSFVYIRNIKNGSLIKFVLFTIINTI